MQYRRFGRTNLKIPVLSLGGMRFQKSWDQLDFSEISYEEQNKVENILNKHLLEEVNHNLESIHNLSSTEIELLDELIIFINSSYKSNLKSLSRSLSICNSEMSSINGKLSNAELKESDPSVKLIRDEKNDVDAKIKIQNERIQTINRKIGENQGDVIDKGCV